MNKLLLCLGLFISLSFVGCASSKVVPTSPQPQPQVEDTLSTCKQSCTHIGKCGGYDAAGFSMCVEECLEAPPGPRKVIQTCAVEVLSKSCDMRSMQRCVARELGRR